MAWSDWLFNREPPSTEVPPLAKRIQERLANAAAQGPNTKWMEPSTDYGPVPNAAITVLNNATPNPWWYLKTWGNALREGFTPENQQYQDPEVEAAAEVKAGQNMPTLGVGVAATGNTGQFEGGTKYIPPEPPMIKPVVYPDMPSMPGPAPLPETQMFDFQPYLDRMYAYEPEDLDRRQYMKDRLLANLSRAFAAGASGSGWSGGAGAFARFGSGFGLGQADTTDAFLAEQAGIDEDQRQFGMDRLSLELRLAQEAQRLQNENAMTRWQSGENTRQFDVQQATDRYNIDSKNAAAAAEAEQQNFDRLYNHKVTVGQLTQSRVLPGTGKGVVVLEHTDPDGRITYDYKNFNDFGEGKMTKEDLNALQDTGTIFGVDSADYQRALYSRAETEYDIQKLMARQAVRAQSLEQLEELVPELDLEALDAEVRKDMAARGIDPSSDKGPQEYEDGMASLLANYLDLNNDAVLELLAAQNNYGAQRWLEMKQMKQQPGYSQPGSVAGAQ